MLAFSPSRRDKLNAMKRSLVTLLILVLMGGAIFPMSFVNAASVSSTTIESPATNAQIDTGEIQIEGSYQTTATAQYVGAVLCVVVNTRCTSYVETNNGDMNTKWRALRPTLNPSDTSSGTYSMTVSNLSEADYKLAVFVFDDDSGKGPRTTIFFSVTEGTVDPPVDPPTDPTSSTTVLTPADGIFIDDSSLTIGGTYVADGTVEYVGVVMCVYENNRCGEYVQSANGELASRWRSMEANLVAVNEHEGSYELDINNLPENDYKLAVFVFDDLINKGPRTYVFFSMSGNGEPEPPTDNDGYITIMWGRTDWKAVKGSGCSTELPGARTLEQNAQDLSARGLYGVGGVVINRVGDGERPCFKNFTYQPSWDDLANLRDTYGWKFVSQGMNYVDMTQLSAQEMFDESAATLPVFESHGHFDAWGAFNYPNNKQNSTTQALVSDYFAFGRKYSNNPNTKAAATAYPNIMNTLSINGGRCNNPALACYNMSVVNNRRTTPVDTIANLLNPGSDEWSVVQYYRLVEGSYGTMGQTVAWDCTSASWQDRWTSQPELTCRNNFLEAIDGRSIKAQITHPAEMAQLWAVSP